MRTTLSLDPDVHRLLEEEMHRQRKSFKEVVNRAIRSALAPRPEPGSAHYVVVPHVTRLAPGIDAARMNQLADELEVEEHVARRP